MRVVREVKIKSTIRRALIETIVSAGIALTLLGIASEVPLTGIWNKSLLLISGLMLGVFCFYFTLLNNLLKEKRKENEKILQEESK